MAKAKAKKTEAEEAPKKVEKAPPPVDVLAMNKKACECLRAFQAACGQLRESELAPALKPILGHMGASLNEAEEWIERFASRKAA